MLFPFGVALLMIIVHDSQAGHNPDIRAYVALTVAATISSAVYDHNQEGGVMLAWLAVSAVAFTKGAGTLSAISAFLGSKPKG